MTKFPKAKDLGTAGEIFVADLLKQNGWEILATQWRCRWGELDIVARDRQWLIFVEVKTRSDRNWDNNGLLAITATKQRKLLHTAMNFLQQHPNLANLPCRFDLALVKNADGLQLCDYLESAFSLENK